MNCRIAITSETMMTTNGEIFSVLPTEILLAIVRYIPIQDLCNVVLVSRDFWSLASDAKLWAKTKIDNNKAGRDGFAALFGNTRFGKLASIDLSWGNRKFGTEQLEEFFKLCIDMPSLEELNLEDRAEVAGTNTNRLLGRLVKQLKKANFRNTGLTTFQSINILTQSLESKSLEDLNLADNSLSHLRPTGLLAKAISRLKVANLERTMMSRDQTVALLEGTLASTTLTHLVISREDITRVPLDILEAAVSRLVKVDLEGVGLSSPSHLMAVLNAVKTSNTLESLSLFIATTTHQSADIYDAIPPLLFAQAICKLKKANLGLNVLHTSHSEALMTLSLLTNKLTNLNLQNVNLCFVSPNLLAKAVARLTKVDLSEAVVTVTHCKALMTSCADSKTLKNARLGVRSMMAGERPMAQVDPKIIAKAISRLENVDIGGNCLTPDQCLELIQAMVVSKSLKVICLKQNVLSDMPVSIFSDAISRLEKVDLWGCKITHQQCTALLKKSIQSKSLKFLKLGGQNLSSDLGEEYQKTYPNFPELPNVCKDLVDSAKLNITFDFFVAGVFPRLW